MVVWHFVDFLTTDQPTENETCGNVPVVFYELDPPGSSHEDLTLNIVCPCFPDQTSDRPAYDYCLSISVFDGCPNFYRHTAVD